MSESSVCVLQYSLFEPCTMEPKNQSRQSFSPPTAEVQTREAKVHLRMQSKPWKTLTQCKQSANRLRSGSDSVTQSLQRQDCAIQSLCATAPIPAAVLDVAYLGIVQHFVEGGQTSRPTPRNKQHRGHRPSWVVTAYVFGTEGVYSWKYAESSA